MTNLHNINSPHLKVYSNIAWDISVLSWIYFYQISVNMTIDCVLDLSELTLVSLIKTLVELEKSDSQSNQNITLQPIHMTIN